MRRLEATETTAESVGQQTLLLNIPPRFQWDHGNGFCGEMCIQSIGLYYGAWISQHLVRSLNKGEYLLQPLSAEDSRDPIRTLAMLHFTYEEWDWEHAPQPQFDSFCHWMKRSLLRKHPVIFGIFLTGMDYDDYDHIVPAVGIRYEHENGCSPEDKIIYYDLYEEDKIERCLNAEDFSATRKSIRGRPRADDGCIPFNVAYGIAITGIVDDDQTTLPVHLSVSESEEPDPWVPKDSIEMDGTVTVKHLTVGKGYTLLRYASFEHVPTKGHVEAFLQSNYDTEHHFTATDTTYMYNDPKKIISTKSVYYRCVPILEQ